MDPVTATLALGTGAIILEKAPTVMYEALKALYGIAKSVNDFIDEHIAKMKDSKDEAISQIGRVLEMAKIGFGIGFFSSAIIIAAGQAILGNPLSAAAAVITAPFNPIVMTCAAAGALYYGWRALTDDERNEIVEDISKGFKLGSELINSVVKYVIDRMSSKLTEETIENVKRYMREVAKEFGKTIADITRKTADKVKAAYESLAGMAGDAAEKTWNTVTFNDDEKDNQEKIALTCGHDVSFSYTGSVKDGVKVSLPKSSFSVSAKFFKAALETFKGKEVAGGFSMTNPTPGGFGEWVRDNSDEINCQVLSPRHASFIAAIFKEEGFLSCEKAGKAVRLKFR